ncbi:class I adenylate-forming enzyme family protein [Microbacterium sp. LWH12-1.2]|uniref:class I adenylate-forming enzyme family protein n=1 Tax=Microbacterium sp. LWH12-1.2 TaxID=3135259 RepID=UPI003420C027
MHRVATVDPDRVAIVGDGAHLTYAELAQDARGIAAFIDGCVRALPVSTDLPVVGICVRSAFVTARLVVGLEAGSTILTVVDPQWPQALQIQMIRNTRTQILLTDVPGLPDALRAAGWGGTIIPASDLDHLASAGGTPGEGAPMVDSAKDDDAPFLMLFSSGTTGTPKAFLKTRAQYLANVAVSREFLGAHPGVATFTPGPLSYSLTLYALFEGLATGGRVHVADRLDELWLTGRAREENVTRLVTVPSALHALADAAHRSPARFEGLRLIITGGAALSSATRARVTNEMPQARLVSYYGAGELGFIGDSRDGDGTRIRLYPRVEALVRDDAGHALEPGELGTLWVRSGSCTTQYLPHTTDAELSDAEGWATVHDQGSLDGRMFVFAGRRGEVVATGGHKVALAEVERAFDGMPGVGGVCAIALPHPSLGTVVGLVLEGDDLPSKRVLREWAASQLPSASVPRRWHAVPSLPRTGGGKVRRGATVQLVLSGTGATRL